MYQELAGSTDRARPRPSSPTGSASTPTPCACTSNACARRAWSTSRRCTAARSAGPSTSTRSRRARPGLGLRPAELHAARRAARRARPSASAPTATKRPRSAARGASKPGRRTRSRSCVKALAGEMERLGFDPDDRDRRATAPTSRSSTARSGSWPRPIPSWSATCTAGICEGRRRRRSAGEESRSSRRCTTATRAGSPFRSE